MNGAKSSANRTYVLCNSYMSGKLQLTYTLHVTLSLFC